MSVKQTLIIRKDLKMRRGKEIAQSCHASMAILLDAMKAGRTVNDFDEDEQTWYLGSFRKICLYVNSEQELLDIYEKAKEKGLRTSKIIDSGLTEFHGVPTLTCIAIGPNKDEQIDEITGHLPLY